MNLELPALYKLSSKGATQEWYIETIASTPQSTEAFNRVTYGQLNGKMQTTETIIRSGKNVGKANETTPWEQAKKEANAIWLKQKDKGYGESIDAVAPVKKPMLAHSYDKYKHQVKWPAYASQKYDGSRCLASKEDGKVTLISRLGKPITTMGHLLPGLEEVMHDGETWDGELYLHHEPFQSIMSLVKRIQERSKEIQFYVFDTICPGRFTDRFDSVCKRIYNKEPHGIIAVECSTVQNEKELYYLHDKFVIDGYEGAMLRHNHCPYKEGFRSRDLLKVKKFDDDEFKIVGFKEGKGRFEGMAIFECQTEHGNNFECMPEGTENERRQYWENRDDYLGKFLTVRYFGMTSSEAQVPRFPIGKAVRNDD